MHACANYADDGLKSGSNWESMNLYQAYLVASFTFEP